MIYIDPQNVSPTFFARAPWNIPQAGLLLEALARWDQSFLIKKYTRTLKIRVASQTETLPISPLWKVLKIHSSTEGVILYRRFVRPF